MKKLRRRSDTVCDGFLVFSGGVGPFKTTISLLAGTVADVIPTSRFPRAVVDFLRLQSPRHCQRRQDTDNISPKTSFAILHTVQVLPFRLIFDALFLTICLRYMADFASLFLISLGDVIHHFLVTTCKLGPVLTSLLEHSFKDMIHCSLSTGTPITAISRRGLSWWWPVSESRTSTNLRSRHSKLRVAHTHWYSHCMHHMEI